MRCRSIASLRSRHGRKIASSAVGFEDEFAERLRLKWQMANNGVVYFRNLNEFDGTFLGCCYSYWLDTSTSAGKSAWASILLKGAGSQPLWMAVPDRTTPGAINYVGMW